MAGSLVSATDRTWAFFSRGLHCALVGADAAHHVHDPAAVRGWCSRTSSGAAGELELPAPVAAWLRQQGRHALAVLHLVEP